MVIVVVLLGSSARRSWLRVDHLELVITKFPLDTSLVCDLAYLTKSTGEWHIVLIELEHPAKPIFTKNRKKVVLSAELHGALQQIDSWKSFIADHRAEVERRLAPLRHPLGRNRVSAFKYVLVYGRDRELREGSERTKRFAMQKALIYEALFVALWRWSRSSPSWQAVRLSCAESTAGGRSPA